MVTIASVVSLVVKRNSMAKSAAKKQARNRRNGYLKEAVLEYCGFKYKWLTPYHLRVWAHDLTIDFYPTGGLYRVVNGHGHGKFDSLQDVMRILAGE